MPIKNLHRDNFRWTNGRGHNQKPILVAQKKNQHGLGKKEHNTDQWWLNAFDNQLKALDVSNTSAGEIKVEQTMKNNPMGMTIASKYYIRFVSGGVLAGGVEKLVEKAVVESTTTSEGSTPDGSDVERKRRRKEKREKKEKKEKKGSKRSKEGREETKEGRRERKRLKRLVAKEMAALSV